MNKSRSYDSSYRASQTEQTRNLILDTLAEMVAEDGFEGIIVKDLAARAGIAARTIYRHFPDRNALHDGLADRLAESTGPAVTLAEWQTWPELFQSVYADFDRDEVANTVGAKLNAIRARSPADSMRRRQMFHDSIVANFSSFDDAEIEAMLAVVAILGSSRTWLRLKDEFDMPGTQSGPIMRWIMELVLADIEKNGGPPSYVTQHQLTRPDLAQPEASREASSSAVTLGD